jgi:hypothetical protein
MRKSTLFGVVLVVLLDASTAFVASPRAGRGCSAGAVMCNGASPGPADGFDAPAAAAADPPPSRSEALPSPPSCDYPGCVDGRVVGGLGAIPLFDWWPIKVVARCSSALAPAQAHMQHSVMHCVMHSVTVCMHSCRHTVLQAHSRVMRAACTVSCSTVQAHMQHAHTKKPIRHVTVCRPTDLARSAPLRASVTVAVGRHLTRLPSEKTRRVGTMVMTSEEGNMRMLMRASSRESTRGHTPVPLQLYLNMWSTRT